MKRIDHQPGQRFGFLVVLGDAGSRSGKRFLRCRCDCGAERPVSASKMRAGRTTSCGCRASKFIARHGHAIHGSVSRAHRCWSNMRGRCGNSSHPQWRYYGGRGITVCERWLTFENFLADMGEPPPGLSIDRINNDGNYEPGNCRWATAKQQANNRRDAKPKGRAA